MFGPSLLVCPVTEPGITAMRVYLPDYENGWKLFESDSQEVLKGGSYIEVPVTKDRIPVFIKADYNLDIL